MFVYIVSELYVSLFLVDVIKSLRVDKNISLQSTSLIKSGMTGWSSSSCWILRILSGVSFSRHSFLYATKYLSFWQIANFQKYSKTKTNGNGQRENFNFFSRYLNSELHEFDLLCLHADFRMYIYLNVYRDTFIHINVYICILYRKLSSCCARDRAPQSSDSSRRVASLKSLARPPPIRAESHPIGCPRRLHRNRAEGAFGKFPRPRDRPERLYNGIYIYIVYTILRAPETISHKLYTRAQPPHLHLSAPPSVPQALNVLHAEIGIQTWNLLSRWSQPCIHMNFTFIHFMSIFLTSQPISRSRLSKRLWNIFNFNDY